MTINTPKGPLTLVAPTVELLQTIRRFLPFGIGRLSAPQKGADYGIVMQCEDQELLCIKQQPPDNTLEDAQQWFGVNSLHIAQTLPRYVKKGFSGLYMPCVYLRKKKDGTQGECGFAHFVYPSPQGIESQEFDYRQAFDNQFGHGATVMFEAFCREQQAAAKATKLSINPTLGLDVRPRSLLGSLGFGFLCVGSTIVCLRTTVREEDPTWAILVSEGVKSVVHVPSVPLTIKKEDLAATKGTQ